MYKNLIRTILILIIVLLFGTLGYVVIEKWQFFDALYMTVITLATVGYSETHPLSFPGRIFTIFLILTGISILLYTVSSITSFFIEGE
ncbi:MAG: potassium channel family protein [Elusimicrobia bacterium]|nr:potassium channel family protein [Elusimicrobiota bacterium]